MIYQKTKSNGYYLKINIYFTRQIDLVINKPNSFILYRKKKKTWSQWIEFKYNQILLRKRWSKCLLES